jgi:hypothetical protein
MVIEIQPSIKVEKKKKEILTSTCTQQFITKHIHETYGKLET